MIFKWLKRLRITVFFKSGNQLVLHGADLSCAWTGDVLTKLQVTKSKGWPLFISLTDIEAVQTKWVYRWAA